MFKIDLKKNYFCHNDFEAILKQGKVRSVKLY